MGKLFAFLSFITYCLALGLFAAYCSGERKNCFYGISYGVQLCNVWTHSKY